jgi:error-prone DNA polymerase
LPLARDRLARQFSLDELAEYPTTGAGQDSASLPEELTWAQAAERYPEGVPDKVRAFASWS